jgi:Flp pilus assembly protein TadD
VNADRRNGWRWRWAAAGLTLAAALVIALPGPALADPADDEDAAASDPDYKAGKEALQRKDWRDALKRFTQVALRDPNNADVENYLGFAHRNLGQLEPAFKHYKRALELNPRHRGAHEYAGEAYLLVGDLPRAEEHLAALQKLCVMPCPELLDLDREIKAYRQRTGSGPTR